MNRTWLLHLFSLTTLLLGFNQSSLAQCEAISGTVITAAGESVIYTCPGDGNDDLVQFTQEDTNADLNFQYVVTDSEFNVIGLPPSNEINFEGAGEGTCYVLGFNFDGNILMQAGDPLFGTRFSDGCYQITRTKVRVVRSVADGGTVAMPDGATEKTVCTTDGYDNVIRFTHEPTSAAAYRYVITDDQNNILGLPPGDNLNFEGVFPGVCRVWGLSYTGNVIAQAGDNAAEVALSDGCFELSDNFITVIRTDVDGGTVSTADGATTINTVPGDGNDDIIEFAHESDSDANFIYIVTDENNKIIGTPPGNTVNFEGAGEGICRVWGISYTGDLRYLLGGTVGNFALSSDCFEVSENFVEVIRSADGVCDVSGGEITLDNGETTTSICVDGIGDPLNINVTGSRGENAAWVITDEALNILGLPAAPPFDLDGAGAGTCLIWYLRYDGELSGAEVGANAGDLAGCFDLSNPVTVIREIPDGGMVALADGSTTYTGTAGNIVIDVTHTTTAPNLSYWYIITDANDNILVGVNSRETNTLDLSGAPAGECHIWGWNYRGLGDPVMGENISSLTDDACEAISDNFITVIRQDPNCTVIGGQISTDAGDVQNRAVIANRASGTISVIDGDSGTLIESYDMPNDGQPMYVVHNALNNTVLVGDYNGQIVAFDGSSFDVVGSVAAGSGVFHMWMSPDYQQLWVNNELAKTISVVNPTTLEDITTFDIPADLLDAGFKPHDVIVDPDNSAAYVTFLGSDANIDYVVKYDATTFEEITRAEVGADPHVSLTTANDLLYVASQGADLLQILNRSDLSTVSTIDVPNAHGLGMNAAGTHLYIGNISEGGTNATYTLDVMTNTLVDMPVDAPFAAPHNYAVGSNDGKLYVTHSGMTAFQVSIYDLSPTPTLVGTLNTGMNPFGLAAYSFVDNAELTICADDGVSDAFDVALEGNTGSSAWVITDTEGNILGLPAAPPFDLDGAGVGTCLIWHVSFDEESFSGAEVGNNALTDLEGCYNLSNPITVVREVVDGGIITTADGATEVAVTVNDGVTDVIAFAHTDASETGFAYVVTDEAGIILGIPPANEVNFEGAGVGTCLVWGLAYTGEITAQLGDNALEIALSSGCFDLSDEFVTVVRTEGGSNIVNPNIQRQTDLLADLTVSPNPTSTNFNVQFNTVEAGDAQLSIYNIYGQLVETRNVDATAGLNQYELDASSFVSGNYIIELRTANTTHNVSVVKQ